MAMPQQHRESRSGVSIGASNGFFSLSRAQIISTYYSKNLNIIQTLSIIFHLRRIRYYSEYLNRKWLDIHYLIGMTILDS